MGASAAAAARRVGGRSTGRKKEISKIALKMDPEATGEGLSGLQRVDPLHLVPRVRLGGHGLGRHGLLAQRPLGALPE